MAKYRYNQDTIFYFWQCVRRLSRGLYLETGSRSEYLFKQCLLYLDCGLDKSPIFLSQCPLAIAPLSSTSHEPGAGLPAPHLRRGDALLCARLLPVWSSVGQSQGRGLWARVWVSQCQTMFVMMECFTDHCKCIRKTSNPRNLSRYYGECVKKRDWSWREALNSK